MGWDEVGGIYARYICTHVRTVLKLARLLEQAKTLVDTEKTRTGKDETAELVRSTRVERCSYLEYNPMFVCRVQTHVNYGNKEYGF